MAGGISVIASDHYTESGIVHPIQVSHSYLWDLPMHIKVNIVQSQIYIHGL